VEAVNRTPSLRAGDSAPGDYHNYSSPSSILSSIDQVNIGLPLVSTQRKYSYDPVAFEKSDLIGSYAFGRTQHADIFLSICSPDDDFLVRRVMASQPPSLRRGGPGDAEQLQILNTDAGIFSGDHFTPIETEGDIANAAVSRVLGTTSPMTGD
jgi:hypothetical protein